MTLDEFIALDPVRGTSLKHWVPDRYGVIDVEQLEDGRWRACCINWIHGDVENVLEARCHMYCGREAVEYRRQREWVWEGHTCCEECRDRPQHYFEDIHE